MTRNSLINKGWLQHPILRTYGPAVAGFVGYGSWAGYANAAHGLDIALRSAVVQGGYSFVLTLSTTILMQRLYQSLANVPHRGLMVTLITCSALLSTAYGINWLAGTPEIWMTILPGFAFGSVFTAFYIKGLSKLA